MKISKYALCLAPFLILSSCGKVNDDNNEEGNNEDKKFDVENYFVSHNLSSEEYLKKLHTILYHI